MRTRTLTVVVVGLAAASLAIPLALPAKSRARDADVPTTGSFTAVDYSWNAAGGGNTVTITPGGTVSFGYPTGASEHNADFGSGPAPTSCAQTGGASSGAVPPLPHSPTAAGWSGHCTFDTLGTYRFFCDLHPYMNGTIVVEGGGSVGAPSLSLSSTAARARAVTYAVTFTSTDAIPANTGSITLKAPAGTAFASSSADLFDITAGQDLGSTSPASVSGGGTDGTWTLGATGVPAGHQVRLTVPGVTNPAASTTNQLSVSTIADGTPANTGNYTTTAARSVSAVTASLTSTKAKATGVTYTTTMRLSSTGGLAARRATITLVAPAGTVIPSGGVDVFDVTTGKDLGRTSSAMRSRSNATASWKVPKAVAATNTIRLKIPGVTNPAAGSYSLRLSTSSDTVPAQSKKYVIRG